MTEILWHLASVLAPLVGFVGLGMLLCHALYWKTSYPVKLLLGAGIYAWLIGTLGYWGGLTSLTLLSLITGTVGFVIMLMKREAPRPKFELPWPVGLYLLAGLGLAYFPSAHLDSLNYHLYAIVSWAKVDTLVHYGSAIPIMHVSYADYLYIPFSQWRNIYGPEGLLALQVDAQILTLTVGATCAALIGALG